ncbi:MAG: hypothetical protein GC160_04335 [Acidobacteria bacterium]|nr:hypothetical protein [Acidobacteriota bacterium]
MSTININLETPSGMLLENTEIPLDYTVSQIVNDMADYLELPRFANGRTVEYRLSWVERGEDLSPAATLTDAGVPNGVRLKLISSAPAEPHQNGKTAPPLPRKSEASEKEIEVVMSVLDLNKTEPVTLSLDQKVEDLIRMIAKQHRLPDRDGLDAPILYRLKSKAIGRQLRPGETLREAGVPRHDRLSLLREEIAGGKP